MDKNVKKPLLKGLRIAKTKILISSYRSEKLNATYLSILDQWFLQIAPKQCFAFDFFERELKI